jgi:hypothetical protein
MKKLLTAAIACSLAGCGVAGLPKAGPAVVAQIKQAEQQVGNTSSMKRGEACTENFLGLVATGDATVATAKAKGSISTIATMDREIFGLNVYIPLYAKSCTVVTGS